MVQKEPMYTPFLLLDGQEINLNHYTVLRLVKPHKTKSKWIKGAKIPSNT